MSNPFELVVEQREEKGKGASRRLRRINDKVPGIMYGAGEPPMPLSILHKDLAKALENETFYSHILTIKMDGKEQKAILRDLQRHPYKPRILHFDLQRISAKEKIYMQVPLHFIGEDIAPGVKESAGLATRLMTSVEVSCLPADLPEFIQVDVSQLGLDESIHLSSLKLPKGVELTTPVQPGTERDLAVISIHLPRIAIEEIEAETEAPEAPPAPEATKQSAEEPKE